MNYLGYMTTLSTDIHTKVTRLALGIFSLKDGIESFCSFPFGTMMYFSRYTEDSFAPSTGLAR